MCVCWNHGNHLSICWSLPLGWVQYLADETGYDGCLIDGNEYDHQHTPVGFPFNAGCSECYVEVYNIPLANVNAGWAAFYNQCRWGWEYDSGDSTCQWGCHSYAMGCTTASIWSSGKGSGRYREAKYNRAGDVDPQEIATGWIHSTDDFQHSINCSDHWEFGEKGECYWAWPQQFKERNGSSPVYRWNQDWDGYEYQGTNCTPGDCWWKPR
jgi:hypothetical protein